MLSQSIEGFVGRRLKDLAYGPSPVGLRCAVGMHLRGLVRLEGLAPTLLFLKDDVAVKVGEGHFAGLAVHVSLYRSGGECYHIALLADCERNVVGLRYDDKAFLVGKGLLCRC